MKKRFLNQRMTWPKVIIFAVISAAFTAAVLLLPFLDGTSFQDIGINLEFWILAAVFIIVNCEKWWEASLKTFVFFLISQPLIYLLQVPFTPDGFGIFRYYGYWGMVTLLTLPGAAIAFLLKKKNTLSVIVLSVALFYLGIAGAMYFWNVHASFPHHLLSMIFCIALSVFLVLILFDRKSHRIACLSLFAAVFIAAAVIQKPESVKQIELPDGNWTCVTESSDIMDISVTDGDRVSVKARKEGTQFVIFRDETGDEKEFYITVKNGSLLINKID